MVAGRHRPDAGARSPPSAGPRSVHRQAAAKAVYTDFEDEIGDGDEHRIAGLSHRYRLREVPRQGASIPARAPRPHRDSQAADEQGADDAPTWPSWSGCWPRAASAAATTSNARRRSRTGWASSCARWSAWTAKRPRRRSRIFSATRRCGANQIEFVNLIVDHLTEHGILLPAALYESPFTDLSPTGPDAIFAFDEVEKLIGALEARDGGGRGANRVISDEQPRRRRSRATARSSSARAARPR